MDSSHDRKTCPNCGKYLLRVYVLVGHWTGMKGEIAPVGYRCDFCRQFYEHTDVKNHYEKSELEEIRKKNEPKFFTDLDNSLSKWETFHSEIPEKIEKNPLKVLRATNPSVQP